MIHYHGTPITPAEQFMRMAGRHFCVSYAAPQDLRKSLTIGQSVMFDNGAFSTWKRGLPFDEPGFLKWVDPVLYHPHWAVIPEVIDGDERANDEMLSRWPYGRELGVPVWHMHESIERLLRLSDEWPKISIGSSAEYAEIGTPLWCGRMDKAFNAIARRHRRLPWIHGLRMLGQAGNEWPLASADSTNVAQNWSRDTGCAECKARPIDSVQTPSLWNPRPLQATFDV